METITTTSVSPTTDIAVGDYILTNYRVITAVTASKTTTDATYLVIFEKNRVDASATGSDSIYEVLDTSLSIYIEQGTTITDKPIHLF